MPSVAPRGSPLFPNYRDLFNADEDFDGDPIFANFNGNISGWDVGSVTHMWQVTCKPAAAACAVLRARGRMHPGAGRVFRGSRRRVGRATCVVVVFR